MSHRCEGGTGGGFLATAREEMGKAWELLRGSDAGPQVAKAIGIIDDEIVASAVGGGDGGGGVASPRNEIGSSRMSDGENVERGWASAGLSPLCGSTVASSRRREVDSASGYISRTGRDSANSRQIKVETARSHRRGDEAMSQNEGAGTRMSASPPMSPKERSAASSRYSGGKKDFSRGQEGSVHGSSDRMRAATASRWTASPGGGEWASGSGKMNARGNARGAEVNASPGAGQGASGSGRTKARGAVMATWLSSGSPSRGVGGLADTAGRREQEDAGIGTSGQQGGGVRESRIRKPGWASSSSASPAARYARAPTLKRLTVCFKSLDSCWVVGRQANSTPLSLQQNCF